MRANKTSWAGTSHMANATICAYSQSDHALPQCKCVSRCCAQFPSNNISNQETDYQYPDTIPSIRFQNFRLISRCTKHGGLPLTDKKYFCKCQHDTASGQPEKYTPEKS